MDVREWLESVGKLDELINAKIEERRRLNEIATDTSAKMPDGMPFSNTGTVNQKMQNAVVDLVMLGQELDRLTDKYIDEKQKIIAAIEKLPEKEYAILHRYYIRRMKIEAIAEDLGISTVSVWRIKKKALNNLASVVDCNAKTE